MLKFVPDHFKTKKMCKHAAKKLLLVITYVLDWYKIQEMCNKVVLENGEKLEFLVATKNKECVIKLLTIILMHQNLFLITIKLTKSVITL